MKYLFYTVMAVFVIFLLSHLIFRLFQGNRYVQKGRSVLLHLLISVLLMVAGSFAYLLPYQKTEDDALKYLVSKEGITVSEEKSHISFINDNGSDKVLIFYPGAKVDSRAYSQLMFRTALSGIDVYVINEPFHLAFFCINAADEIIRENSYAEVYVGGHSLGGVAACSYADRNAEKIRGIVLLASYPNNRIDDSLKLLSVYGDRDGVLEKEAYQKAQKLWPQQSVEFIITGGNHAQFAQYGKQKGDGEATITALLQINSAAEVIAEFVGG